MEDDTATATAGRVRHKRRRNIKKGVDLISSLPDVILQHILCFIPTKLAITTSVLSKRWRHVWCDIPSISFNNLTPASISETLTRYTAPKIMNFYLKTIFSNKDIPDMDKWIEFAMSRNVESLSLELFYHYKIPDFFYTNSSIKQLSLGVTMKGFNMVPRCFVSWTSLKKLSLHGCILSEESIDKFISGCPVLESLTLDSPVKVKVLDLTKSLSLRILEIYGTSGHSGPTQLVAPHIQCLVMQNYHLPCTLVDVSSLTKAKLDIHFFCVKKNENVELFRIMVLKMLEKVQNVEKLTFGGTFLQFLSLAEIRGLTFPMLKVKDLTLETSISRQVIPGIERVLQNSPYIKKLTLKLQFRRCTAIMVEYLDKYLTLQGLIPSKCYRSKDGVRWNQLCRNVKSKHVSSFMELMINNTKALEKMVVKLDRAYWKFKELVLTVSRNNNVTIIVSENKLY